MVWQKDSSSFVETWPVCGGFTPHLLWAALRARKLDLLSIKGAGFSWKIPRGNKTEYGAVLPLEKNSNFKSSKETSAALIPQGLIIPKNDKITLCGDAAGLTKPWSGGGVVWGLTAAEILLKNFPNLIKYQQATKRFFLPQIFLSKAILRLVYFLGFNFPWILPKKAKIEGDFFI